MRHLLYLLVLLVWSLIAVQEVGVSSYANNVSEMKSENLLLEEVDSIKVRNERLFHTFFMSMAWVESRHTAESKTRNNSKGQLSCGWVQITPIFVKQANINRSLAEGEGTVKKPKRYYRLSDAHDIEKSKEMIYWVNKKSFDRYDENGVEYDARLWHSVIQTHNPNASSSYRKRIMRVYNNKVKELACE